MKNDDDRLGWPSLFDRHGTLIGMVHLGALPGTLRSADSVGVIVEQAVTEAKRLANAGFDAIIVENMHDAPYVHGDRLGPEICAAVSVAVHEVRRAVSVPLGVQILSGGNSQAIAVAFSTDAQFIRCENFVFAHTADEGLLTEAEAGPLLRYRRQIGAGQVGVFCDIKKKHASHALTADISISEASEAAEFFGADALIVTGSATGHPTDVTDLKAARAGSKLPILVGSGVSVENLCAMLDHASAVVVGSAIKEHGQWSNPVDLRSAERMVAARDRWARE